MTDSTTPRAIKQETIDGLASLEEGWDSYLSPRVSEAALDVLRSLFVAPTTNGGIQIAWDVNGEEMEIEIGPNGRLWGWLFSGADDV